MKELWNSQLPVFMDETSYQLTFADGLSCEGGGVRYAGEMRELLRDPTSVDESEACYSFYRDIVFEEHRSLFTDRGYRYDITVIFPGTINGECKKTSGHYHGYIPGQMQTYPEIYEVLEGKALYILQKAADLSSHKAPVLKDRKAVFVEAGQAIIIPPFYGHCSINVGDGPMVFSNIAVTACPLFYDIIKEKRGLSVYAVKGADGSTCLENNPQYPNTDAVQKYRPLENPDLGIRFGNSVYWEFVQGPDRFEYLRTPEPYTSRIMDMYAQF